MHKIIVGMDFDGCINRLPFPFSWISRHINEDFILPKHIEEMTWKFIVKCLPIVLDGKLLDVPKDVELYVITGRRDTRKVMEAMKPYNVKVLVRGLVPQSELEFKITACKMYKIEYFFDDRLQIIRGLKKAKIDAHDIRELIK